MHALEGVRLIDFGQYLAGPFGPMVIGDLGAEVIKVEPVTGDGMRLAGKPFFGCQRGKRDIALNLKTPEGLKIALELVERADIVHHNMTAGVANKLGIGFADCKRVKPDVVYCNTWAYGLEGPLAHFGGLDPLYQAATGLEYEAGATHTGNAPLYYRFGMCDAANAMLSVVGCLAALYHQRRTGEGQELWTSLLDGGAVFASDAVLANGEALPRPRLDQGLHGIDACYRLYETQDGWIQIAAVKEAEWVALCRVLGVALDDAAVPNEIPVDTKAGDLVLFDADNERLGLVAEYEHPIMGLMRQFGELIQFSETPGHIGGPPPRVGENTREIMTWLGYADDEIDALKAADIINWPTADYPWTI
jgi:crotonobetainyl-CoA:carnitine CoA-transferase CaiB-like acyl-CoA transferase